MEQATVRRVGFPHALLNADLRYDGTKALYRVWDIIEKVGLCMLTTQIAGGLRARPIEARIDRDAGLIFL